MSSANVSPMVWWIGGHVKIFIPSALLKKLDTNELYWILAHELAHVRRRDHWVRWIEWLATVAFWWNPLVWWAQHNLRATEEICCDAFVLSSLNPLPHTYARSLLTAVEYLSASVIRPPVMASEVNSGDNLLKRFKMITSNKSKHASSRKLKACIFLGAVCVLPLGLSYANDAKNQSEVDASLDKVQTRIEIAVPDDSLSQQDPRTKMKAIKKGLALKEKQGREFEAKWAWLQAEVKAGNLSSEEAETRMIAIKMIDTAKGEHGVKRITGEDYEHTEAKLRKMVGEGNISGEDARAKLRAMRGMVVEEVESGERRVSREIFARAEADPSKLVANVKVARRRHVPPQSNEKDSQQRPVAAGKIPSVNS